jgi:hypothetical protein
MIKILGKIAKYEKRFGLIAIKKGFISDDDLIKALIIQVKEENENGRHRLIGEILLDMDVMSGRQIEEVLMEIFR